MNRIKTGVIGLGRMGQHHCRVYASQREAELVGLYDINPEITREFCTKYDVPIYDKLDDLLEQVDAVSIATPTPTHFDLTMHCLEKNVHVLVEKPVTDSVIHAEHLARAVESSGLVVQVGHIERFNPTYVELKKVIESFKVLAINFRRLSPYRVSNKDVDVVLDLMVHDLDLCNDLMGREPTAISAFGLTQFSSSSDHVVAQLFYSEGPLITLTSSRVTEEKIRSIDVTAPDAFLEADLLKKAISVNRCSFGEYSDQKLNGVKYHQESLVEHILVPNVEPLVLEISHFLQCICRKSTPCVSAFDGLKALRLAQQICDLVNEHNLQHSKQLELAA
jgi:virulence factor